MVSKQPNIRFVVTLCLWKIGFLYRYHFYFQNRHFIAAWQEFAVSVVWQENESNFYVSFKICHSTSPHVKQFWGIICTGPKMANENPVLVLLVWVSQDTIKHWCFKCIFIQLFAYIITNYCFKSTHIQLCVLYSSVVWQEFVVSKEKCIWELCEPQKFYQHVRQLWAAF